MLGYGTGDLALSPSRQEQLGTTINLSLAAAGLDGVLLDGGATGLTISSSADGLFLQTGSEKADGLAAAEGDLSHLRLVLAASRPFPLNNQSSWLTPALELGSTSAQVKATSPLAHARSGVGVAAGQW